MTARRASTAQIPAGLRLAALGARFLLIFVLARFLTPSEVGQFGLLMATTAFMAVALGLDFYTYSTRQLLREPASRWRSLLRSQGAFTVAAYLVGLPAIVALGALGLLPWSLLPWALVLIPFEHVGLELDRILIAMQDQVGASASIFVRQAIGPALLIPAMALWPSTRSLEAVLAVWVLFDVLAVALGIVLVARHIRAGDRGSVDWRWIRAGLLTALPFLIGTLCLRALFTVDRQIVALTASAEVLGAYALYLSAAAGMTQALYASVQQFAYPRLVALAHADDDVGFDRELSQLGWRTGIGAGIVAALLLAAQPLLLIFVSGGVYAQYWWILPVALAVTAIYNLSLVPHYALYARDADRAILYVTIAAFVVFVGTAAIAVPLAPVPGVLGAVGAACTALLAGKGITLRRLRRNP